MCALSNGIDNPFFKFYSSDYSANERLILAYKEDKWVFYEREYLYLLKIWIITKID